MRYQTYTDWLNKPMTSEDIAAACEDAADLLEGKWVQGTWYSESSQRMCIEGGLMAALGLGLDEIDGSSVERQLMLDCPVHRAVTDTLAIMQDEDDSWGELPNWNDYEGRTEQEVLDLLHATAKRVLGVEP